jgi:hypothetical protein
VAISSKISVTVHSGIRHASFIFVSVCREPSSVVLASDTIKRVFRNVPIRTIPFRDEKRENESAHLHVRSTVKKIRLRG